MHTRANILIFPWNTKPLVGRAGCNQDSIASMPVPRFGLNKMGIQVIANFDHVLCR